MLRYENGTLLQTYNMPFPFPLVAKRLKATPIPMELPWESHSHAHLYPAPDFPCSVHSTVSSVSRSFCLHQMPCRRTVCNLLCTTLNTFGRQGAALPENNEASIELTTVNGGTFISSSARLLANHVTDRSISDRPALT